PGRARLRARDQEASRILGQAQAASGDRQMTGVETVTVRPEDGAGRLDRWCNRHYPGLSHGRLEKLLRTGQIRVDGKRAKAGDPIAPGQAIRVPPLPDTPGPAPRPIAGARARPQDLALLRDAVIYRDDWAIVVNKPPDLAVQGGTNTERHVDALLDGLRFDSDERPRLVHRLDKDTSGVLLIARNAAAATFFTRAFRDKTTRKIYWAIVAGLPELRQGRIDLALVKRGGAPAASACAQSGAAAPGGRYAQRHRPVAAAYAAHVGIFRLRGRGRRPVCGARSGFMKRVYKEVTTRPADGGWGIALDSRPMR